MRNIVLTLIAALAIPTGMMAQDDDLYFVPSSKESKTVDETRSEAVKATTPDNTVNHYYYTPSTGVATTKDIRDVDEYNRRYSSSSNDDLYVDNSSSQDGEWLNGGFNGSDDDYEYAQRIIRFRNPRFAISIGSPLYFDIVYGLNSWDWNVYTDGFYAYAFPTFSNPLWWDWRWNSYSWGWGWNYGWPSYWGGGLHLGLGWAGLGFGWDFGWHNHGWHNAGWGWGGGHGLAGNFGGWRGTTLHNDRRPDLATRGGNRLGGTRVNGDRAAGTRVGSDRMNGYRVGSDRTAGTRVGSDRTGGTRVGGDRAAGTRAGSDRSVSSESVRRVVTSRQSEGGSYNRQGSTSRMGEGSGSSDVRRGSASYSRPSSTRMNGATGNGGSSSMTRGESTGSRQSAPSYSRGSSSSSRSSMGSGNGSSRSSNGGSRSSMGTGSSRSSSGSGFSGGSSRGSGSSNGGGSHSSGGGSSRGGGHR